MLQLDSGKFIISLDFELHWGVHDSLTLASYKKNIKGVWQVIPQLLKLFSDYEVNATFATVGFLLCKNKEQLINNYPKKQPNYSNVKLSPYNRLIDIVGNDELDDPLHFCYSLIEKIRNSNQEIGTHTFSHYYTLEDGQNIETFEQDLISAKKLMVNNAFCSIVFPRNQYDDAYLTVCAKQGLKVFRGTENHWSQKPKSFNKIGKFQRFYRFLDAYINLSGNHVFLPNTQQNIVNVPASRFLRPYAPNLKLFEGLKIKRIKNGMKQAAKQNKCFHLWWHPHNFGVNQEQNFKQLIEILEYYTQLKKQYGFESWNMSKFANTNFN